MAKIERHFAFIWYCVLAGASSASLPLDWFWWGHFWTVPAQRIAWAAFFMFLGAEWSAPGVKDGYDGTMTAWTYSKIHERFWRVLFGVWLAALIGWRITPWLGGLFVLWLPLHYYRSGFKGPIDRFVQWLGKKLHIHMQTA